MKRITVAMITLLISTILTGCFKQDWSLCGIDDNCVLVFKANSGSTDLFSSLEISSVDVALFDSQDLLIEHRRLDQNDLKTERGTRFTLEPGTYKVVCWGNVAQADLGTMTPGITTFSSIKVKATSRVTDNKLYYAPEIAIPTRGEAATRAEDVYTVVIPPQTQVTKEMDFVRVHRTVNVYIRGYEDPAGALTHYPTVELNNIPTTYNYDLKLGTDRVAFKQVTADATAPNGQQMIKATFHTKYYNINDNSYVINVIKGSGANPVVYSTNLKSYIDRYSITDLDEIDVLFLFDSTDAEVSVILPPWQEDNVTPELNP